MTVKKGAHNSEYISELEDLARADQKNTAKSCRIVFSLDMRYLFHNFFLSRIMEDRSESYSIKMVVKNFDYLSDIK